MNTINEVPKKDRVDLTKLKVLCWDNGLFVDFCRALGKTFDTVWYFMPWVSGFPKSNQYVVGEGIDYITRVHDFFDYVDEADLIIFPDVYMGDLMLYLEQQGKLVFGCKKGEQLELLRDKMKEHMKKLGMYVTPYKVVKGLDNLREHLKDNKNVWVKQNILRGDFETFFSKDYGVIEPLLDELEHNLGAYKHIKEFIVEEAYDNAVESGMDLYTCDGKFPSLAIAGIEIKDCGYVCRVLPYDKIDERLTGINDALSDTLKDFEYRGFFSTEVRLSKDRPPYLPDWTSRLGSPPNEIFQNLYTNLAEIVYYTAKGYMIDPIVEKEYAVEALLHSSFADKNWLSISFPEKYRDNIKLRNCCKIKGKYYCAPQHVGLPEIGAIVALGDTLEEAISEAKKIAETIHAHYLDIKLDSFDKAQEEFDKLKDIGIDIMGD
jgi:phosphoribosylamine-glycine ligase